MKLAVISDAIVEKSHGTGNLLLRLLESAPLTATSFHPGLLPAKPALPSFSVKARPAPAAWVDSLRRRMPALASIVPAPRAGARRRRYLVDGDVRAGLAAADLVLAVVHTTDGLDLVEDCLAGIGDTKPVVLWFMDLLISPGETLSRRLPTGARVWALNSRIKAGLEQLFPSTNVEERMFVGVTMPPAVARTTRPLSAATRCVMIGNVWDTSVLPVLDALWTEARARHGFDLAIHWYAPPQALERVAGDGIALGSYIRYEGHAPDLDAVLGQADVAIMAFSGTLPAAEMYRRYSFPSRVADYAANGLPVFAICGNDTALADYLTISGAGVYDTAASVSAAGASCAQFLASVPTRQACAVRARRFAESHFDLDQERDHFVAALVALLPPGQAGTGHS